MRKVFTFCLALGFTIAANAQNWEIGQDITDYLEWRDISGWWEQGGVPKPNNGVNMNPNPSYYWQGTQPNEMAWDANDHNTQGYAAMGFYTDGAAVADLVDCYQIIPMVAGKYQIAVNAVYREGTPADTWNNFCEGNIHKNSHLYVQYLATENGEALADYDCVIKNLAQSSPDRVTESLFEDSGNTWKNDGSYKTTDADGNQVTLWYPNSDEGAALHFEAGNFLNTLNFIVLEDGYIRFGFRKTANIDQDWLVWANFRMYWMGEADEQAQIDLALEELDKAFGEAQEVQERATLNGYVALASIIEDELIEFSDTYSEDDLESIKTAITFLNAMIEGYKASYTFAASLGDLVEMSQDMALATDFPGATDFNAAILAAETVAFAEDPADLDYDAASYITAFTALSEARAKYLDSQEPDPTDGSKDFTMLIKHPWFVQAQYTPVKVYEYDGDEGFWCIQEGDSTTNWHYNAVAQGPVDAANAYSDGVRSRVADGVQLRADGEVANRWFKVICYTDGWSAGLKLMYQGSLIGVSDGWNSMSVGDQELRQRVEGLPAGYYQLRALMRGNDAGAGKTSWEAQANPHHNIFARNSDGEEVRSSVGVQDKNRPGWEQWGWNEWNGRVWDEHKTSIIQAPDGKLTIGAMSSMVMNSTGYRLYFMGVNPNYTAMLLEDIEGINASVEKDVTFLGDKAAIEAIVAKIVLPCETSQMYDQYTAYVKEAKDYIDNVKKVLAKWTAADDFVALQSNYDESDAQYAMIQPAVEYTLALGEGANDTYKDAQTATANYNAYKSYFVTYDKCAAVGSDALNAILAEQAEHFKGAYLDAETVAACEAALSAMFAEEYIKQNGGADASESNPLDVTALIVNPKFDEGAATGWSGQAPTQNEYARHNSEVWNVGTWDTYQYVKGLPAGKYLLKVQALYRDADGGDWAKYTSSWEAAGCDKAAWAKEGYPVLYAQECAPDADNTPAGDAVTDYITSVADLDGNDKPSFEGFFVGLEATDYPELSDASKFALYEELNAEDKENSTDADGNPVYDTAYDFAGDPVQYPFDARQDLDGGAKFYPESMAGAYLRFREGKYDNTKVTVDVNNGGYNLKVGIKKTHDQSGNWVIFTNFRLYFLGYGADAIETAKVKTVAENKMFNLAGQAVGREYKGIVIKNGQKVLNK